MAKKNQGRGRYNEFNNHALAAKGVKVRTGGGNQTAVKHKVSDSIQNDMHKLDKLLRQASDTEDFQKMQTLLQESEHLYEKLAEKIQNHKEKYGELPWWVSQTWQGKENFTGKNGKVRKQISQLKNVAQCDMKKKQKALFDMIKLEKEQPKSMGCKK